MRMTTYPYVLTHPLHPPKHLLVCHYPAPLTWPVRRLRNRQHLHVTFTWLVPLVVPLVPLVTPRFPVRKIHLRNAVLLLQFSTMNPLILTSFHVPSRTPKPTVVTNLPLQTFLPRLLYHFRRPPPRLAPAFHFCSASPVFFTPPNRVSTAMSL